MFARHENRTFTFSKPRLLPGEKVSLKIPDLKVFQRKDKKHIRIPEFEFVQSNSPSVHEIAPVCPHFARCGGCQLLHCQPSEQREQREALVEAKLEKFQPLITFHPLSDGAAVDFGRLVPVKNRGNFDFAIKRAPVEMRPPVDQCAILRPILNEALDILRAALRGFAVFDERTARGLLRDLIIWRTPEDKVAVIVLAAPGDDAELVRLKEVMAQASMANRSLFHSVSICVSNAECPGADDASDFPNVGPLEKSGICAGILDHRLAYCNETEDAIFEKITDLIGHSAQETLIVNCPERHRLRRVLSNATFLNDVTDERAQLERSENQMLADIKGADVHVSIPGQIRKVVVAGRFSEGMRKWCIKRQVQEIVHFTKDLNKIAWDAERLSPAYKLVVVDVYETRPHTMEMFFVSRLVRF
jgi:hypothetical protein